jgi:hypothetical protein
MRTSDVFVREENGRKKRVTRRSRKRSDADAMEIEVANEESALVREERIWLTNRLQVALEKTRSVLDAVQSNAFADESVFNELLEMQTLEAVMAALKAMNRKRGEESLPARVFISMFTDEEWSELEASQLAISNWNEGALRTLRLRRQYSLFWDAHAIAVDVSQIDDADQVKLVEDCKQVVGGLLNGMGMGEHQLTVAPAPSRSSSRSSGRVVVQVDNVKQKATKQQEKKQKKIEKPTTQRKRVSRVADDDDEEVDQDEGDGGLKKAKVSSDEVDDEQEEEEEQKETHDSEGQGGDEEEEDDEVQLSASLQEKQPQKKQQQHVVAVAGAQEHDEEHEKDEEEDEEEEEGVLDISALLEKAKVDVVLVSKMLKEMEQTNGEALQIEVPTVEVPDMVRASEDAGKRLLLDEKSLVKCLCSDADELSAVEQWAALVKWWRLVDRCLAISGIFAHLRAQKHGTLRERYEKMVASLKSKQKLYSHSQAAVYDRLGKFLLEYPRFVYQLQWVSLADWGKDGALIKSLRTHLSSNEQSSAFWKVDRSKAPLVHDGCQKCNRVAEGFELWQCSECDLLFHEMCMGYLPETICADIMLPNGSVLEAPVFCPDCLVKMDLTVDDVAAANKEVRTVGQYLLAPACKFEFKKIPEDGFCCFRILEETAQRLKWKGSQAAFCKQVAKAAVKVAEAAAKDLGKDALESNALQELAKEAKPVYALRNGLWKKLEVHYILQGFVNMFPERVVVNVYQATQGQVRNSSTYGSGTVHVNLLHWNMTQHFDSLVAKP